MPPKVRISSALKLGCLTGMLTACAPALLCSLALNRLIHTLRRWVLSWDGPDAELSIGGLLGGTTLRVSLDLQDHLKVANFLQTLERLESGGWWMIPVLTLLLVVLGGILLATLAGTGIALYNWIGRSSWLVPATERQPHGFPDA